MLMTDLPIQVIKHDWSDNSIPMVSVVCITYNHKPYIREAIESFLMQMTNFHIEILIGEDYSTDGTRKIVFDYEKKYLDLIRVITSNTNVGMQANGIRTLTAARGKYIALCEGDDYWTDPYKLQKQVDFLEKNPDYGMVYSKAKVYIEKNKNFQKWDHGEKISSFNELLLGNHIPSPTVMFRKDLYFQYIEEIQPNKQQWMMGDYPMWLYFTAVSKIKFLDNTVSVYRILNNSASHSDNPNKELIFLLSYRDIKLFYMNRFGLNNLEKKIFGHFFSSKARIYLFKNEQNISELVKEINECNIRSFKISIVKLIISNWFLRKIIKLYWSR